MCHRPCSSIGFRALVYGTRGCGFEPAEALGTGSYSATYLHFLPCSSCVGRSIGRVTVSQNRGMLGRDQPDGAKTVLLGSFLTCGFSQPSSDTVPMVLGCFSKFSLFPFGAVQYQCPALAGGTDALGSNPSSYGVRRVRFPHGARAVNNMFSVAGHDIHGISASIVSGFLFLFYSLAGHGSGTLFLGIVGRKKIILTFFPMTGIPFFLSLSGCSGWMSATKVDRGEAGQVS